MKREARKQGATQESGDLGSRFRQMLLPLLAGIVATKKSLTEWVTEIGLASVVALMEADAEQLVGPKGKHQRGRQFNHWGATLTPFPYAGRHVVLPRPRVRTVDRKKEVAIPSVEAFLAADPINERVIEQVLLGISMRGYEPSLGPAPKGAVTKGTKRSRASEIFVEETTRRMKAQLIDKLDGLDLIALMIDGLVIAKHTAIVALGIDIKGDKHVLGLRLGSTENKAVCVDLLQDLLGRGLQISGRILCVLDGSKALRWAIQDVLGDLAVVQRCIAHKRRNVKEYLPQHRRRTVERMLCEAYASASYKTAKQRLQQVVSWLERNGEEDAAASLSEGMEETLTVLKLGLPPALCRMFSTTNAIENMVGTIRRVSRNVTRWRDGTMAKRWVALGLSTAQRHFHRIKGHRHLPALVAVLRPNQAVDREEKVA